MEKITTDLWFSLIQFLTDNLEAVTPAILFSSESIFSSQILRVSFLLIISEAALYHKTEFAHFQPVRIPGLLFMRYEAGETGLFPRHWPWQHKPK